MHSAMGRQTTYSEAVAEVILEELGNGTPLAQILRNHEGEPGWPKLTTVYDWQRAYPEFAERVARAREAGYDHIATEQLTIADEEPPVNEHGQVDSGWVTWQKNRIWTRQNLLKCWDPKRYGERVEVAGDPDAPLIAADASPNALARTIAFALHQGLREKQLNSIPGEAEQVDDGADMV